MRNAALMNDTENCEMDEIDIEGYSDTERFVD